MYYNYLHIVWYLHYAHTLSSTSYHVPVIRRYPTYDYPINSHHMGVGKYQEIPHGYRHIT